MAHFLDAVPFSGIIRIRDMMYAVKDPFRLDQGDVSFDAPETVKRAMHRAIDENHSHYVQTTGIPRLLNLIVAKLRSINQIPVGGPDEVMVTNGGIHGLYILCQSLLEPGDEVIVPDPEWPPCMGNIRAARGVPVPCRLHESLGWRYEFEELASTITPKTKAIYINSPHNPTGGVATIEDLKGIAELVRDVLEPEGWEVRTARDGMVAKLGACLEALAGGVEALTVLEGTQDLDLLIADLEMPELAGEEVVRRIRVARPDLKVLYVTGHIDRLLDARSTLWEGEAFLDKPFTPRGLLEAVSLLLYGRLPASE